MATKRSHDGETKHQLQQQHHYHQQQQGGNNNNNQQRAQHPQQHERRRPSGERDKPTSAPNTSTVFQEKDGSGMVSAENNMSSGDVRIPNSAAGAAEQVSRKKGRPKSPVPKNGKSEKGTGGVGGGTGGSGKNQQQEQQETMTPDANSNNALVSNISTNDDNGNSIDNSGSAENGQSPTQHLAVAATTAAATTAASPAQPPPPRR